MKGYRVTGRGWALAVVCAALLSLGVAAIVSSGSEPPDPSPPPSGIPVIQVPSSDPSPEPSPPPSDDPSPTGEEPVVTPPDSTPIPPASPPPADPSPSPEPSPLPSPEPSPPPPPPVVPSAGPPVWANDSAAIMFGFDSAEMLEAELARNDLADMLPTAQELIDAGYVIVVTAFTASDEETEGLAQSRADAVYDLLIELGIPSSSIRLFADPVSTGTDRWRQRATVYFLEVGNK